MIENMGISEKHKNLTINDFLKTYSNDDSCLDFIFKKKYGNLNICPRCEAAAKFYRAKSHKYYSCGKCGYKIYPLAGTIMHGSTTKLTNWFYAIFLFSTSKNGVSAKELQRSIGVTYKCAWRMGHKIRELMKMELEMLSGIVEMDETLIGGKVKGGKRGWGAENKTCVFGMIEREGKVKTRKIPERKKEIMLPIIKENIESGTILNTDEFRVYKVLNDEGYRHQTVIHSKYQWRNGDSHTNSIEGYWSNLKKSILGTHTYVSPKHLQSYLDEFSFRHNRRKGNKIFEEIINRI